MNTKPGYRVVSLLSAPALWIFCGLLTPSIAAGQDPAVDNFEKSSLGSNWTLYGGSNASIVNNSDLGVTNTKWCFAGWTASTFGVDQSSEAVISPDKDPNMLTQVFVRRRNSDLARYAFHWNGDPGMSQWEIKYDGVLTPKIKILALLPGPGPKPGDTLRIEVSGTSPVVIKGYHQGKFLLMATDASEDRIVTAGVAGLVARMPKGMTNTPPTPIFESWVGGSLSWYQLGNGLAGSTGVPSMAGVGLLTAGSTASVTLNNALPNSVAILVVGNSELGAPFLGGVLVPNPDVIISLIPIDHEGKALNTFALPAGIPAGLRTYAQYWIPDPGSPQGFASSNAILAITR